MAIPPNERPGRNEKCHCGSGKKYKHCCLDKDEAAAREERAKKAKAEAETAAAAAPTPEGEQPAHEAARHGHGEQRQTTAQPWKAPKHARTLPKFSTPRRVGSS